MRPKPHHFDPAMVEWVYESRFAIVSQLQRRFAARLPSLRTAQRHAQRLVQLGLLAPAPVRSTGPNFPLVLYATGRGIRLVQEAYAKLGKQWDGATTEDGKAQGLALDSILHEILVSEVDLSLQQAVDARSDLTLLERERRYFRRDRQLTFEERGRVQRVIPDAGYLTAVETQAGRKLLPVLFLELENGTHSVAKIREKLLRYQRWAEQAAGEYFEGLYGRYGEPDKRSFRLLFVAHDKHGTVSDDRRLVDIVIQTAELPRSLRDSIWLTTADALAGARKSGLNAPIWCRARDTGRLKTGNRRQLIEQLKHVRRHSLLPQPE